jgi:hypothetical protein
MKRLVVAAALAAGSLLVHPLDAAAQSQPWVNPNWEAAFKNGTLICGYQPTYSWVVVNNWANTKGRSFCRWKCVYKLASGEMHVNAGARNLDAGKYVQVEKSVSGIVAKVEGTGGCVVIGPRAPTKAPTKG